VIRKLTMLLMVALLTVSLAAVGCGKKTPEGGTEGGATTGGTTGGTSTMGGGTDTSAAATQAPAATDTTKK
jgi:hypothetical protein